MSSQELKIKSQNSVIFDCKAVNDPFVKQQLKSVSQVKSLSEDPKCLPNIHAKKGLESPPQFVAVTNGTNVPMLSAPSMNCGMSVFKTNLTKEDFNPEFLNAFAKNLRKRVLPRRSRLQSLLSWFGISERKETVYDLTKSELDDFFLRGAKAAIEKYDLPREELNNIEYGGNVFRDDDKPSLKGVIPRSSYSNGRHEMGYNFGGNHFLELHFVESIQNEEAAKLLGIKENQLVLFYHGGGGHATYHLGRYYGARKKNSAFAKFTLFILKIFFHFGSIEGLKNFGKRWNFYFTSTPFPEIPLDSVEGKRIMTSIKASLNYGYGFRVALLRRIRDALHDSIPQKNSSVSFLWDASHNSILEEQINGEARIVHRQDAMRVFPERPVMIAGDYNTLSYIGIGGENLNTSYASVTPSAGKTIESLPAKKDNAHITLRSKRKDPDLKEIPHRDSIGLIQVVEEFEKQGIIKPVAYIRPLAGIKGH